MKGSFSAFLIISTVLNKNIITQQVTFFLQIFNYNYGLSFQLGLGLISNSVLCFTDKLNQKMNREIIKEKKYKNNYP